MRALDSTAVAVSSVVDIPTSDIIGRLREDGFLLMRGFGASVSEFEHLTDSVAGRLLVHGNHRRERVDPVGTTQTVSPGRAPIGLHREMGALPWGPDLLFMFCERPSAQGGETVVCDGAQVFARLSDESRAAWDSSRIVWRYRAAREEWSRQLGTDSASDAVERIHALLRSRARVRPDESYRFAVDGESIIAEYAEPAVFREPGMEPVFCNSALHGLDTLHANRSRSFHVDIEGMTDAQLGVRMGELRSVLEDCVEAIAWEAGDILAIDNWRMLHGRLGFSDPRRRILLRMGYSRTMSAEASRTVP